MIEGIMDQAGTIAAALFVAGMVTAILFQMRRDRSKGKSPCGGYCGNCPMSGCCHPKEQNQRKRREKG